MIMTSDDGINARLSSVIHGLSSIFRTSHRNAPDFRFDIPMISPPALLWGVRRYLAAPHAIITAIHRQPFPGGLSGSKFEYWRLNLRRAGAATALMLVYKQGLVVRGAFMQGAPQREALAYANLPGNVPLTLPTIVAVDAPAGDIWMLPFPPAKAATHWRADWDETDVRAVIADLARLHAAFWDQNQFPEEWHWLLRPTLDDARRLLADGLEGLQQIREIRAYDDILTAERIGRLLDWAYHPEALLDLLNASPMTLLHGDAGFQNIAITRDGRERIWYDWQLVGWGASALDWATFLHPWGYPEADPPISPPAMTALYLQELRRRGVRVDAKAFSRQLDAAFLWRWLIQWGPLLGKYKERLRPEIYRRLGWAFEQYQWPALTRLSVSKA